MKRERHSLFKQQKSLCVREHVTNEKRRKNVKKHRLHTECCGIMYEYKEHKRRENA